MLRDEPVSSSSSVDSSVRKGGADQRKRRAQHVVLKKITASVDEAGAASVPLSP